MRQAQNQQQPTTPCLLPLNNNSYVCKIIDQNSEFREFHEFHEFRNFPNKTTETHQPKQFGWNRNFENQYGGIISILLWRIFFLGGGDFEWI